MKLLELLVRDLHKFGGWPDGYLFCVQDGGGTNYLKFGVSTHDLAIDDRNVWVVGDDESSWGSCAGLSSCKRFVLSCTAEDYTNGAVTREQYEAALAALQQPVWNGEGLPPVDIMCEVKYRSGTSEWSLFKCVAAEQSVAFGWNGDEPVILLEDLYEFRPIRSEADKKRDEALSEIASFIEYRNGCSAKPLAGWIYDAIAAGKIPGIKLSD